MHQSQLSSADYLLQNCEICMLDYQRLAFDNLRPAGICYSCWKQHVQAAITRISYQVGSNIISPFNGGDSLDVCIALNSLYQSDRQEMEEWLFKKYTTFTPDIDKCPSQTCNFAFMLQRCRWGSNQLNCPKCDTPLNPHSNLRTKSILGFIYFMIMANKCPKCNIPIQKTSGCPHMTCPCGHEFCWFCLKDHSYSQNPHVYTVHQPKQCLFIFFSRLILLFICFLSLIISVSGNQTCRIITQGSFTAFWYIAKAIAFNLWIFANIIISNHLWYQRTYQSFAFSSVKLKKCVSIMTIVNILIVGALYQLDWLGTVFIMLCWQLGITIIGGLTVYILSYLTRTWFEYIM